MRILLVEDHPIVRLGLRTAIEAEPDMTVVGEAETAEDAVRGVARLAPDLVILALRLEGERSGPDVCRALKARPGPPAVLVYTAFDSAADASASYLAGADGFLHRRTAPGRLLSSIRDTYAGRRVWVPREQVPNGGDAAVPDVSAELTARESEVLGLILLRYSNAQIAERLGLRLPTVKTHVRGLLRKLGVRSRRELF
jgi:DNA-binding NarL/FixJ family response regulator